STAATRFRAGMACAMAQVADYSAKRAENSARKSRPCCQILKRWGQRSTRRQAICSSEVRLSIRPRAKWTISASALRRGTKVAAVRAMRAGEIGAELKVD